MVRRRLALARTHKSSFFVVLVRNNGRRENALGILWIILIVVVVLALLGFFARAV